MALLQIAEPDASPTPHAHKRAVGIDLGTTNSLVATVRNGFPVVLPDEDGHPLLPSIVRYTESGVEVGTPGSIDAGRRPAEHDRLGQAAHGAWTDRPHRRAAVSLSFHRRTGNGAARHARRRQVARRGIGGDPARIARPRGGEPWRLARGRCRHRPGVFRRSSKTGDEGRGAARGARRAAAPERAHGGRDRLRSRQRGRRHLRGLRPGRRHFRHLDPAVVEGRIRGARDQRRLGARRRRFRPSRPLLGDRDGRYSRRCRRPTRGS